MTISNEDKEGRVHFAYFAAWYNTKSEITDEQAHKLFQALGWKNTWALWYKRAWWKLKSGWRALVRAVRPSV